MIKNNVLVIAGASGVGKTTIAARLLSDYTDFGFVRSITTRAPRGDGHDGEYIYTDREDFTERAGAGELIEYMEYGSNLYGTPKSELDRIFSEGKIPLLILDLNGVKAIREYRGNFTPIIFYIYDSLDVIEKRLYDRDLKNPTADKLLSFLRRKEANINDYLNMPTIVRSFDAFIKNTDLDRSVLEVRERFDYFILENEPERKENEKIAELLSEMAKEKMK